MKVKTYIFKCGPNTGIYIFMDEHDYVPPKKQNT